SGGGGTREPSRGRRTTALIVHPAIARSTTTIRPPIPSPSSASIRMPSEGGGGGETPSPSLTFTWIESALFVVSASGGETSEMRTVKVCSPSPTTTKGGAARTTDAPGFKGADKDNCWGGTGYPSGRISTNVKVAAQAAKFPWSWIETSIWTTSFSDALAGFRVIRIGTRSGAEASGDTAGSEVAAGRRATTNIPMARTRIRVEPVYAQLGIRSLDTPGPL